MTTDPALPDADFDQVYQELRSIARRKLGAGLAGHTLQATALVNETWLKLASAESKTQLGSDPSRFFALAAKAMRFLLVDHARKRSTLKRDAGRRAAELDPNELAATADPEDAQLLQLDAALEKLREVDERKAKVVELRHFAGLSVEDTAKALELSPATVKREWSFARAWLEREMTGTSG